MSVKETAGGKYQARWRDPAGRQRAKSFTRLRDAERFERDQLHAIERGEWVDPAGGRTTVAEAAADWYTSRAQTWKPKTKDSYSDIIANVIVPAFGDRQIRTLKPSDIQTWVNDLAARLSPHRTRNSYRVLSQVLDAAVDDGLVVRNPASRIRLPPIPKKQTRPLTAEQVRDVADATTHPMYATLVWLLGTVGLRWGEAAGLQVGDLDGRILWIRRSLSESSGHLETTTTKTHAQRQVPLPGWLVDELDKVAAGKDPDDWLFEGPRGGPLRYSNFRERQWRPALERCGLPPMKLHSLRDTAASTLISKGANVKVVQRVLGHASAAMTLDVYGHYFDHDLAGVAALLD